MSRLGKPIWVLFSVIVLDLVGFGVVMPILPFYAAQYGASATVLGWLLTCYSLLQFLFAPFWGKLSDRIGRRSVLLITIGGSCLSLFILGTADSLWLLFVGRGLSGFFAANISVASAFVADLTGDQDRTAGMGLIGAAFGVGFILGPAIGGFLAPYGYAIPILAAALLSAGNLMYASLVLREPACHQQRKTEVRRGIFSDPTVLRLCTISFLFTVGISQLESIFAFYMMDRFHYDAREVAFILAAMAIIMVVLQGGGIGVLARRLGEYRLLLAGTGLLAFSMAAVPLAPNLWVLSIPLALASIGRGVSQPSLMSLVSKRSSVTLRGATMGAFQSSASLGRVVGPLVAGFAYDIWSPSPFYLAGILAATCVVLATSL